MFRWVRLVIGLITGFIAMTAIGGGVALLIGAEEERFALAWLAETPFDSYTIPALLACLALANNHRLAMLACMAAGLVLMVFIKIEVWLLQQVPRGRRYLNWFLYPWGDSPASAAHVCSNDRRGFVDTVADHPRN